ncbi:hypothetical protein [Comamonas sp. A7-5]|uniref:hypothetical protein n=1 Tax=Comamonas sp. A7-5 TaxID=673549 RepID=UPI0031E1D7A0
MKTKAITYLLMPTCLAISPVGVIAKGSNSIAKEVKKAAIDSLEIFRKDGVSGLADAVSDCWREPRDFCLYLDFASHHVALGATYTGIELDEYFYTASVNQRGRTWLEPNGRGQTANDQFLDAVDQVMTRTLVIHQDKMFEGMP